MLNMPCTFKFSPFPTLKTERFTLRKLQMSDAKLIFNYQSNKAHFQFVDMPVYEKIEEAEQYIQSMNKGVENDKWIIWAIKDDETDAILGTISIWNLSLEGRKGELGFGLFPGNRGKGIMDESLKSVVNFGFNSMGLREIDAYTNTKNERSISLLERNGFIKIRTVMDPHTFSGEPMEMAIFNLKYKKI
jgi:[ribosomal protein S5]-alanine N-acetyltransferase